MAEIYKPNFLYFGLKRYVNLCFRIFYKNIYIKGLENIPEDKALIYAPNHVNALMDALAVAILEPFTQIKVFVARSDIFNSSFNKKALGFLKIIPAFRIRDGYEHLNKNHQSFYTATDVLKNNGSICIMPEGNQGPQHKIRPLVKGIFRIAFNSQLDLENQKEVVIIPIGFEYGHIVEIHKDLIIQIGKPIPVKNYLEEYKLNPAKAINEFKNDLKISLEELTVHIPENFEIIENVIELNYLPFDFENQFIRSQNIAKKLSPLLVEKPDFKYELESILDVINQITQKQNLNKKYLSFFLKQGSHSHIKLILEMTLSIPFASVGFLIHSLPGLTVWLLRKKMNIKQEGFFTSVHFVLSMLLFPAFYILFSILLTAIFKLHYLSLLIIIPLMLVSLKSALLFGEKLDLLKNQLLIKRFKKKNDPEFQKLQELIHKLDELTRL